MGIQRWLRALTVATLIIGLAIPFALAGSDFWAKKPYQQWSAEEIQHIMEESPWATTLTLSSVQTAITSGDSPNNHAYRGEMETDPTISYNLQFRSAQPIREAQVRTSELNAKYDTISADKKVAVDASAAKFLAVTFPDRVIVAVTFHTNVQDYESQLRTYWERQNVATLTMTTFLDAGKERLSLLNYGFKDDTFQFTFPRPKQINPNEKIGVEFLNPRIQLISQQRILQEFSLKKMLVNGEPSF